MEFMQLLERLKMEHLLAQLEGVCEQAAKGDLDYQRFLADALEAEWRGRQQRGIESRLKLARFPWIKTLDQFDFEFQPSIDRKVVRELAALSFVGRAENVVLLGPPGVGKTHCDTRASMARERQPCQAASHRNEMTPKLIGVFRTRRCLCFGYVSHPKGCRPDARRLA
jgi:hypothetical protein